MQIINIPRLSDFAKEHDECRVPFAAWRREVEEAKWNGAKQVQLRHQDVKIGGDGRVHFPFLGRSYWVKTRISYERGLVVVEDACVAELSAIVRSAVH